MDAPPERRVDAIQFSKIHLGSGLHILQRDSVSSGRWMSIEKLGFL
jgi:hypothetical protein